VSGAARKLLEECLALSEDDRRYVASELIASVAAPDPGWEAAWAAEVERRAAAADAGESKALTWAEVKARLEARRAGR